MINFSHFFFPFVQPGDVALCNAARERHIEVMDFLLTQKVNHERLLNNRKVRLVNLQDDSTQRVLAFTNVPLFRFLESAL